MHRSIRATVTALLLIRFVDETAGFLAPASVERFRADLGIGYGIAAGMFIAYGVGGLVGNVVVARSDGRSRRGVTVGGTFVLAAGLAVCAGAGFSGAPAATATMLLGAALIAGGATGLVHGGEISLANSLEARGESHRLERVLARTNLWAIAGDIAGPLLVASTRAAGIGWRPMFLVTAAGVAAYGVVLSRVEFPPPHVIAPSLDEGRADLPAVQDSPAGVAPIARQATVWLLAASAFATMPLDEAYFATVLAFAEVERGIDPALVAVLGLGFVAGGILTFTVLTETVARTPLARLLTVCATGMSVSMVAAALGPAWVLIPAGVVHSALLDATWLGQQTMVLRANPGREGATKLVIEVVESASFGLVLALGVLADRAGLPATMLAYAAVPLLLVPPARALGRRRDGSRARSGAQSAVQTTSVSSPSARS